mmetsp:Transcript_10090/g.40913  ORF Transcript_10090/g.40913 Transcript_10090/m.40913 type:complete len:468 (+) Transcript_10090:716-2119(+)
MRVPVRALRRLGYRILAYLDDFLTAEREADRTRVDCAVGLFEWLGIIINYPKSTVGPTQQIEHLGFLIDSVAMTFRIAPKRHEKFRKAARDCLDALAAGRRVEARAVSRVTGHAASAALVLDRDSRVFTRFLNDAVRDAAADRRWSTYVTLNDDALAELRRWADAIPTLTTTPIRRPQRPTTHVVLATDASDFAFGGGVVEAPHLTNARWRDVRGAFTAAEMRRGSTWREMRGALGVLTGVGRDAVESRVVDLRTDSLSFMQIFEKGGSQTRDDDNGLALHRAFLDIERAAQDLDVNLRVVWVPRSMNTWADEMSKVADPFNFSVRRDVFDGLDTRWGPHDVDRFAGHQSALLARFNSRWWCPGAEAVDTFSVSWAGANNWLHPPNALITRVVAKLHGDQARGTLVVPRWTAAPWWPLLREGSSAVIDRYTIPGDAFVAHEQTAFLGNGRAATYTMLAIRVDFGRRL